jgi:hypothetical protein
MEIGPFPLIKLYLKVLEYGQPFAHREPQVHTVQAKVNSFELKCCEKIEKTGIGLNT